MPAGLPRSASLEWGRWRAQPKGRSWRSTSAARRSAQPSSLPISISIAVAQSRPAMRRASTPSLARIGKVTAEVRADARRDRLPEPVAVGISSPGPLDPWRGIVLDPPNLRGWHDVPIVDRLSGLRSTSRSTWSATRTWPIMAEWRHGVARDTRNCAYITVSTGIGGALVIGGRPLVGTRRHGRRGRPHHRRARRSALRLRWHRPRGGHRLGHRACARGCAERDRATGVRPRRARRRRRRDRRRARRACRRGRRDEPSPAILDRRLRRHRRPVRVARERTQSRGHRHRRQHRRASAPALRRRPARDRAPSPSRSSRAGADRSAGVRRRRLPDRPAAIVERPLGDPGLRVRVASAAAGDIQQQGAHRP